MNLPLRCYFLILFILFTVSGCQRTQDPLTREERAWLAENDGRIVVNNETGWAPIISIDEAGVPYGIAVDYYRLIEHKLGFRFKLDEYDEWGNILNKLATEDFYVVCDIQLNESRTEYALFTEAYISIPNVIIVQQDAPGRLSPDSMSGMKIAVSEGYAIHDYLISNYPELELVLFPEDRNCLHEVVTSGVDAAIVNLAVASYIIETEGISNLRIAGKADYENSLSFASGKKNPILNRILQKGFDEISAEEHEAIYNNWIHLDYTPLHRTTGFRIALPAAAFLILIIFVFVFIWNKILRKQIDVRTRELRQSEARYQHLVESIPGITYRFRLDDDWTCKFISREIESLTGYPQGDFIENRIRSFNSVIHPDDLDEKISNIRKSVAGQLEYINTYRIIGADGNIRWVLEKGQGSNNEAGENGYISGVIINITERKLAQAETQKLRNYLSNIIDSMPSIIIGVDNAGLITLWNLKAEQAAGIASAEAEGQPLELVFPRMKSELEKINKSIGSMEVQADSRRSYQDETGTRYEDVVIYPLVTNGISGAVIRLDDVTDMVHIEEMLIQNEKMLSVGGLAAGMAHEINNPLAGILQTSEVLSNRLCLNDGFEVNIKAAEKAGITIESIRSYLEDRSIPRLLETIRESSRRVSGIVANMLSFTGNINNNMQLSDLAVLIDRTIELASAEYNLSKQFDFKQISIKREYQEGIPAVPCESSKIQQVLLNIFRNGAYAMAAGEVDSPMFMIRLSHLIGRSMVCIEIENNGPGMPERIRKRIFEPFFTTKPTGEGTGLGLSLSYFIVTENHGGEMEVESGNDGKVKFIIRLPV